MNADVDARTIVVHSESTRSTSTHTPINRIPFELLGEIFLTGWCTYGIRTAHHFALLVSSVCQWWRRVALETPELWTKIPIEIFLSHTHEMATNYLQRSRRNLLHLQIADEHSDSKSGRNWDTEDLHLVERRIADIRFVTDAADDEVNQMMHLLAHHLSRWKVVELVCTHLSTLRIALSHMHGEASSLTSCSLSIDKMWRLPDLHSQWFPDDFSAPVIACLNMSSFSLIKSWLASPFIGLQELIITDCFLYMEKLLRTLSSIPHLNRLTLDNACILDSADTISICWLHDLERITFRDLTPDRISEFLFLVRAPILQTVGFACLRGSAEAAPSFAGVLAHIEMDSHFPKLHHLIIDPTDMYLAMVLAILDAHFPRRLTLHSRSSQIPGYDDYYELNDDALMALGHDEAFMGRWNCPKLQVMEVPAEGISPASLRFLVNSRLEASQKSSDSQVLMPSAIKSLRVSGPLSDEWLDEDTQWLIDHVPDCVFEL